MKKIVSILTIITVILMSAPLAEASHVTSRRPAAIGCVSIKSNLAYGMRDRTTNGSIVNLQAFLNIHGYLAVEPTGYFGPLTLKAVTKFQSDYHIPATGFVGPLTRSKITELTCGISTDQTLVISLVTDKEIYDKGEPIKMTLSAMNNSSQSKILNWNSGCQTHYTIDGEYNSMAAMLCIAALTSKVVPAGGSVSWEMEHDQGAYELTSGTHVITGVVDGYGNASKTITVR